MKTLFILFLLSFTVYLPSYCYGATLNDYILTSDELINMRSETVSLKYTTEKDVTYNKTFNDMEYLECISQTFGNEYISLYNRDVLDSGVDANILKCLILNTYEGENIHSAESRVGILQYLQHTRPILRDRLTRYDGNYMLALESLKFGIDRIDYLYLTYGDSWMNNIHKVYTLNGDTDLEALPNTNLFSKDVLKYFTFVKEVK